RQWCSKNGDTLTRRELSIFLETDVGYSIGNVDEVIALLVRKREVESKTPTAPEVNPPTNSEWIRSQLDGLEGKASIQRSLALAAGKVEGKPFLDPVKAGEVMQELTL